MSAGIDGAGAGSSNTVATNVQAIISDGSVVTTTSGGNVSLTAKGSSIVRGDRPGGLAFAVTVGVQPRRSRWRASRCRWPLTPSTTTPKR